MSKRQQNLAAARRIADRNQEWELLSAGVGVLVHASRSYGAQLSATGATWIARCSQGWLVGERGGLRWFGSPGAALRALGFNVDEG